MKLGMLDRMYERMEREVPDVAKLFAPRRYVPPQGYANPRDYAPLGAVICGCTGLPAAAKAMVDCRVNAFNLVRYQVPTYFVRHDFGAAVMATEPPDTLTVEDLVWPMPAMLFVIPESLSLAVFKRFIPFISVSRLPVGECHPPEELAAAIPAMKKVVYSKASGGVVMHAVLVHGEQPVDYSMAASDEKPLVDAMHDTRFAEDYYDDKVALVTKQLNLTEAEDVTIINKCTSLAFGLLLAMSARREMVEIGALARPEKRQGFSGVLLKDALWHPNFVGRNYRVQRGEPAGGHYRNQFFGKNRAGRRLIWVEPMMVNAEQEVVS